jgi:hypothetical protein
VITFVGLRFILLNPKVGKHRTPSSNYQPMPLDAAFLVANCEGSNSTRYLNPLVALLGLAKQAT